MEIYNGCQRGCWVDKKKDTSGFKERLGLVIGHEKPYAWAKRVGLSSATFARIWSNGSMPKTDTLLRIAAATGVSLDWLLTGRECVCGELPGVSDGRELRRSAKLAVGGGNDGDNPGIAGTGDDHKIPAWPEMATILRRIHQTEHPVLLRVVSANLRAWSELHELLVRAEKTRRLNGEIQARLEEMERELAWLKRD
ncbi:CI repressor [Desulfurivibrio alkaliphilus AHT 2]|uniref:CI repressor n=1 Tax=Desulfurivibrio alkaliphilus (strain DSM 19089 / UNIQEM U267 / AHT2) TaxID=589865 RepID=D6Z259_DESAT|nr:CI repressor [Desulfurivibrio alkaliphilus AHT 2]